MKAGPVEVTGGINSGPALGRFEGDAKRPTESVDPAPRRFKLTRGQNGTGIRRRQRCPLHVLILSRALFRSRAQPR